METRPSEESDATLKEDKEGAKKGSPSREHLQRPIRLTEPEGRSRHQPLRILNVSTPLEGHPGLSTNALEELHTRPELLDSPKAQYLHPLDQRRNLEAGRTLLFETVVACKILGFDSRL